jgi:NAD(P)-dependent dehydrogenase (short-subunit alcohol dehydrogenase family)
MLQIAKLGGSSWLMTESVGIITGGASGIGEAAVERLLRDGHSVIALDRDAAALEQLAQAVASPHLHTRVCDVSDEDNILAAGAWVKEQFGGIDFLVNSAGIGQKPDSFLSHTTSDFDRVLAINLRGTMLMMKLAVPMMRERGGGSIVNIGSVASTRPSPFVAGYSASKYGVAGLSVTVAVEEGKSGIRVNVVCPGFTQTPMYEWADFKSNEAKLLEAIPMRRILKPDDIANLVSWLVSSESSYVTGQLIAVDGGISLT